MSTRVVLYHKNCPDGFGAAWAAHKRFGDDAVYMPIAYGEPLPDLSAFVHVLFVDFTADRPTMERLVGAGYHVEVYDHHKSAQQALEGLAADRIVFDMERSGAGITWDELMGSPRPDLIRYVEDRDLWRWRLPDSRAISAWTMSFPYDFTVWSSLDLTLTDFRRECAREGSAILRHIDRTVDMICDQALVDGTVWDGKVIFADSVPVVNATAYWSEIGERLLERFASAPYAVSYFSRKDHKMQFSLRSRSSEQCDVSEVAKTFGGGGHKHAAGFTLE